MTPGRIESWRLIAPYAIWMGLMTVLPSTAWAYALRTGLTVLVFALVLLPRMRLEARGGASFPGIARAFAWGVPVGVAVCVLWIAPERLEGYRRLFVWGDASVTPSPYDPAVCGWSLTWVRLVGSGLVISVAEELFFRKWLIGFAGFGWMVALFAIEHDRWLVGAIAGAAYGLLFMRKGLGSAIVAHAVTNLLLGFWVIKTGQWGFW